MLPGAPVILGGWIGGLAYSPTLGAILQVIWEMTNLVRRDGGRASSALNLLALAGGLVIMYVTDMFVTL